MSHNIPQSLLHHAKEVAIDFDVTKLTKRQMINIRRNVLNGHSPYNNSAPSHLVTYILEKFNVPHFRSNGWRLYWRNLPSDHYMFETLTGLMALEKLNPDTANSSWKSREIDDVIKALNERKANSYLAYYHLSDETQYRNFKKTLTIDHSDNAELVEFMDKMQSGEMKTLRMVLWKNHDN